MKKHSCRTYLAVLFTIDYKENARLLQTGRDCLPEEIGIFNKDEVEAFITDEFGVTPVWDRHHFVIGFNDNYDVDINHMIRVTLTNLLGKEDKIQEMCTRFGVSVSLELVPEIATDADTGQSLSLDADIIEFLYKSGTAMDLDYYIV